MEHRTIVASSLRFGLDSLSSLPEESVSEYIHVVGGLMSDPKVGVREGAVKSMGAVAQFYPQGLRHLSTEKWFWESILHNSRIDKSLIVVIDYGLCKEVRDLGKNLRLETFNLLELLVKKVHLEEGLVEELRKATLDRMGTYLGI